MASFLSPQHRGRRPSDRRRTAVRTELRPLESRSLLSGYTQLNLVGYRPGMARRTDPDLNGWGLDFGPNGPFCVANTSTGVATFHDQQGNTASPPVTIPAAAGDPPGTPGSPTGVVYNPTRDFVISEGGRSAPAEILFDTLDGLICGWNPRHLHDARAPGRRPLQTIGAGPRMSPGAARDRDVSAPSRGLDGPSGQYEGRVAISMMLTPAHLRVDAVTTEPTGPVV